MSERDEYYSILTEHPDGPVAIEGTTYSLGSIAVKNSDDCSHDLTLLLKISWQLSQSDGKHRLLAKHLGLKRGEIKLLRTVLLGPPEKVLSEI